MIRHFAALAIACGILMSAATDAAHAQSVEQFYKGRQMTMIVGTAPGGINDITARFVARHLGR
jgi:tripartite-type tricarboxylate transporter receptor subunit TctC